MKLVKSLLLGTAAGVIVCAAGAQAADLPSRKAAPVEYVRICDALTLTGYFYIPGTDTCLNVSGRVRAEYRWTSQTNQYTIGGPALYYYNGASVLPGYYGAPGASLLGTSQPVGNANPPPAGTVLSDPQTLLPRAYPQGSGVDTAAGPPRVPSFIGPVTTNYTSGATVVAQPAATLAPNGTVLNPAPPLSPSMSGLSAAQLAAIGNRSQVSLGSGLSPGYYGRLYSGTFGVVPTKGLDQMGFRARGRIQLDARTNTAWGWLRTFVRFEITYDTGRYINASWGPGNTFDAGTGTNVDKAFIQWAGITAGKAQSMFDFYADNYGYQDLRGSDASVNMLAYTATFGGGFSATLSLEDSASRRAGILAPGSVGAANLNWGWGYNATGVGAPGWQYGPGLAGSGLNSIYGTGAYNGAAYNGLKWPDIVAALRVDQPWGAAQLSAAIHNQNSSVLLGFAPSAAGYAYGPVGNTGVSGGGNSVGWAVQGGVQIKLPMLAAGDDLWIQAAYAHGALDYQQVGAQEFGRYPNGNGWRGNGDGESVFYVDNLGYIHHTVPNSWTVLAAINHYFTPTFATSLRASYLQVNYGNGSRYPWSGTAYDTGGSVANPIVNGAVLSRTTPGGIGLATNWSEWRVGINPEWYPVKGLTLGFELMYVHLNQKAPLVSGWNGATYAYGGSLVGGGSSNITGVKTWNQNSNGWEARFRVQRDF